MGKRLGNRFPPQDQEKICSLLHCFSIGNHHQESGYKILMRWYYTPPIRLRRTFSTASEEYWTCGEGPGDFLHTFWFWDQVHKITQRFTGHTVPKEESFLLFRHNQFCYKHYKCPVLVHLINAACSCIPTQLKSTSPPHIWSIGSVGWRILIV